MTDEQALYMAVLKNPDDTLARLVLLDYWQENGADHEWVEFCRHEVAGNRLTGPWEPIRWVGVPAYLGASDGFEGWGGLPDRWLTPTPLFRMHGRAVLAAHPVRTVRLTDARVTIRIRREQGEETRPVPPVPPSRKQRVAHEKYDRWRAELVAERIDTFAPLFLEGVGQRRERTGTIRPMDAREFTVPMNPNFHPDETWAAARDHLVDNLTRATNVPNSVGRWIDEMWALANPEGYEGDIARRYRRGDFPNDPSLRFALRTLGALPST